MKNKCWVVKIGSALLTNNGKGIDKDLISEWVEQIVELKSYDIDVVLVSSGSIVELKITLQILNILKISLRLLRIYLSLVQFP